MLQSVPKNAEKLQIQMYLLRLRFSDFWDGIAFLQEDPEHVNLIVFGSMRMLFREVWSLRAPK